MSHVEQIYQFLFSLQLEISVGDPAVNNNMDDYLKPVGYLGLRQKRVRPAEHPPMTAMDVWRGDSDGGPSSLEALWRWLPISSPQMWST